MFNSRDRLERRLAERARELTLLWLAAQKRIL
jgi:hypothetical protein